MTPRFGNAAFALANFDCAVNAGGQNALLSGGEVIQDKALRFAAEHGLSFEVSEAVGNEGTRVEVP
jgi:hypothetical protein